MERPQKMSTWLVKCRQRFVKAVDSTGPLLALRHFVAWIGAAVDETLTGVKHNIGMLPVS